MLGRPRKLTVEGQRKLVELTTDNCKAMKALKAKDDTGGETENYEDSWQKAFQVAAQMGKPNARATTTFCRSTMYNYRKELGLGKEEAEVDMDVVLPMVNDVSKPRHSNKKCCGCSSTGGEFRAQWRRCTVKNCRVYSCGNPPCDGMLDRHTTLHTNYTAVSK